uniref:Pecanex-like protein n=1 Tax=Heterorhabditis bacteriophora TaxID=37862 RepID=A0A1I7WDR4_HETBA
MIVMAQSANDGGVSLLPKEEGNDQERSILISLGLDYNNSLDLRDSPEASTSPENVPVNSQSTPEGSRPAADRYTPGKVRVFIRCTAVMCRRGALWRWHGLCGLRSALSIGGRTATRCHSLYDAQYYRARHMSQGAPEEELEQRGRHFSSDKSKGGQIA